MTQMMSRLGYALKFGIKTNFNLRQQNARSQKLSMICMPSVTGWYSRHEQKHCFFFQNFEIVWHKY